MIEFLSKFLKTTFILGMILQNGFCVEYGKVEENRIASYPRDLQPALSTESTELTKVSETHNYGLGSLPKEIQYVIMSEAKGYVNNISLVCKEWKFIADYFTESIDLVCCLGVKRPVLKYELDQWIHFFLDISEPNNLLQRGSNLRTLSIRGNALVSDNTISKLTTLISLDLDHNYSIADGALLSLTNLRHLSLRFNTKITDRSIKNLLNLEYLDIRNVSDSQNITDEAVFRLTNLTSLGLHCRLRNPIFGRPQ